LPKSAPYINLLTYLYNVQHVIERFSKGGNTINLRAIDLNKASDKVNHHARLMIDRDTHL